MWCMKPRLSESRFLRHWYTAVPRWKCLAKALTTYFAHDMSCSPVYKNIIWTFSGSSWPWKKRKPSHHFLLKTSHRCWFISWGSTLLLIKIIWYDVKASIAPSSWTLWWDYFLGCYFKDQELTLNLSFLIQHKPEVLKVFRQIRNSSGNMLDCPWT